MSRAVIVAGGTAGHINAAIVLGQEFNECGFEIEYVSGRRHLDFQLYRDKNCRHVYACPLVGKNPLFMLKSLLFNFVIFKIFLFKFIFKRPQFVFGAGGYVCGPVLLAAYILGIPVFILEQNSVMGLTNKILSRISKIVFTNFNEVKGLKLINKVKNYGNPIRKDFFNIKKNFVKEKDIFHILAFGGSLGSREINELVLKLLQNYNQQKNLFILHQVGKNKMEIGAKGIVANIQYKMVEYIDNMAEEFFKADLIICRGGASTISELRVVKRPVIIIPLNLHRDRHQFHNAKFLQDEASFPVNIESANDLSRNSCEKLQDLINEVRAQNFIVDSEFEIAHTKNPSALICQEILKNVSA